MYGRYTFVIKIAHNVFLTARRKQKAALASALGEYFERLSTNYFFADFYLGQEIANGDFVHYPTEKWFPIEDDALLPEGILDDYLWIISIQTKN